MCQDLRRVRPVSCIRPSSWPCRPACRPQWTHEDADSRPLVTAGSRAGVQLLCLCPDSLLVPSCCGVTLHPWARVCDHSHPVSQTHATHCSESFSV